MRPHLGFWPATAGGSWFPRRWEAQEGWGGFRGGAEGPLPTWVPWNPGNSSCPERARRSPANPAMPYLPPCSPDSNTVGWLRPRKSPPARDQRTRREGGASAQSLAQWPIGRLVGGPGGGLQCPGRGSRGRPSATQREGRGRPAFPAARGRGERPLWDRAQRRWPRTSLLSVPASAMQVVVNLK